MGEIFQSSTSAIVKRYPPVRLKSGRLWHGPFWDSANGVWARQDYNNGLVTLARFGLRYPTAAEQNEVAARKSTLVTPVCNQPPDNNMASLATCRAFDACIAPFLDVAGWDALVTAKTWEHGADDEHSWLHGFYVPRQPQPGGGYSAITQNQGRTQHNRRHVDYSQFLYGVELLPGESAQASGGGPLPLPGGKLPGLSPASAGGAGWIGVGALVALAAAIVWRRHDA